MSNAFDIERARDGEPIEYLDGFEKKWVSVSLIGSRRGGTLIVEDELERMIHIPPDRVQQKVRMAPKKIKVRYRVAILKNSYGDFTLSHVRDGFGEKEMESEPYFVQWADDWVEAEIEQ